jgi:hypothetical protein
MLNIVDPSKEATKHPLTPINGIGAKTHMPIRLFCLAALLPLTKVFAVEALLPQSPVVDVWRIPSGEFGREKGGKSARKLALEFLFRLVFE